MPSDQSLNLDSISKRVFEERKGQIYIGNELIKPEILDVLKEQARYLETSQLYEILRATIINESADLALKQSQNWEQVQFAKALHHWVYVFDNILLVLKKK